MTGKGETPMTIEELEAEVRSLKNKIRNLEDIERINRLENIYGYYLDNARWDEITDLFSDSAESLEIGNSGVFLGKEGVRRFFSEAMSRGGKPRPPWWMHVAHQMQPVIDVSPDGKTATGRWQGLLCLALRINRVTRPIWGQGVYTNDFVKEDGKWLFKKLHFHMNFHTPFDEGWVKNPVMPELEMQMTKPDAPSTEYNPYPSGYTVPFHYKHPITGK
jgi:hypothetical protein